MVVCENSARKKEMKVNKKFKRKISNVDFPKVKEVPFLNAHNN